MNKTRRNALAGIAKKIQDFHDQIDELKTELEVLCSEEQDYFDNMPPGLQAGDKGTKAEEAVSEMENATSRLDDCLDYFNEAIQSIEDAC